MDETLTRSTCNYEGMVCIFLCSITFTRCVLDVKRINQQHDDISLLNNSFNKIKLYTIRFVSNFDIDGSTFEVTSIWYIYLHLIEH